MNTWTAIGLSILFILILIHGQQLGRIHNQIKALEQKQKSIIADLRHSSCGPLTPVNMSESVREEYLYEDK